MATKTVVCPACDAPLTAGRFACPACGTLVASVASAVRPLSPAERAMAEERDRMSDAAAVVRTPVEAQVEAAKAAATPSSPPSPTPVEPVQPVPAPAATLGPLPTEPAPRPRARRAPSEVKPARSPDVKRPAPVDRPTAPWITNIGEVVSAATPAPTPSVAAAAGPKPVAAAVPATVAAEPSWPAQPSWPPPVAAAQPVLEPAVRVPAGLYLPPSAVLPPGEAMPSASPNGNQRALSSSVARTEPESPTEKASMGLSAVVGARVLAAGASIAALGFFLPWANFIIGSGRSGGWLDQWGVAGSGHPVLLLVLLALAGLGVTAERLPSWVRPGVPAIAVGGLLFGVTWPYVFGAYGAWTGVYVVTIGALLLVAGGWLDLRSSRHARSASTV